MTGQLTTRERAASILSGAKLRMLEDAGMTVVTRQEWYAQQAQIARLEAKLVGMREHFQVALEHWEMYEDQFVDVERQSFEEASSVLKSSTAGEATL